MCSRKERKRRRREKQNKKTGKEREKAAADGGKKTRPQRTELNWTELNWPGDKQWSQQKKQYAPRKYNSAVDSTSISTGNNIQCQLILVCPGPTPSSRSDTSGGCTGHSSGRPLEYGGWCSRTGSTPTPCFCRGASSSSSQWYLVEKEMEYILRWFHLIWMIGIVKYSVVL